MKARTVQMRMDARAIVAVIVGVLCCECFAAPFREVSPGVFENGSLRIESKQRIVLFPAKVNQVTGPLEYGIVTPSGSVHESLLVTELDPIELHAAFLLLGVKAQARQADVGSGRLNAEALALAPELEGVPIEVRLLWQNAGAQRRGFLEDWIRFKPHGKAAASGPWTYTGSYFAGRQFAAAAEGALLCLVTNASSLMNNPRQGHRDDQAWEVYSERVPAQGTPVTVEIEVLKLKSFTP